MRAAGALQRREVELHRSVAYLLASVTPNTLNGKQAAVHRAFYEVAQQFPDLLPSIAFSREPSGPYSRSLERALFCLASARLLSMSNPSFEEMRMTPDAKRRIKEHYGAQLRHRASEFAEAAGILAEALRTEEAAPST
jgi:hypothetical protein